MRKRMVCRRLTGIAVFAVLIAASPRSFAQTASQAFLAGAGQIKPAETGPGVPPAAEEVGDALMLHQRYQAAIAAYKKASPDSANVWNKMGIAYQMMFNLDDAARCYKAALKVDPHNARAFNNMGSIYDSLKQYADAERMYRRSLRIDPGSAIATRNLGTNLLAQKKYKKGWEAYQTALTLDPDVFDNSVTPTVERTGSAQERGAMNYYMARGCVRAGQTDRAIDYLRRALNEGFTSPRKIEADTDFASLRGVPAFQQLLSAQAHP